MPRGRPGPGRLVREVVGRSSRLDLGFDPALGVIEARLVEGIDGEPLDAGGSFSIATCWSKAALLLGEDRLARLRSSAGIRSRPISRCFEALIEGGQRAIDLVRHRRRAPRLASGERIDMGRGAGELAVDGIEEAQCLEQRPLVAAWSNFLARIAASMATMSAARWAGGMICPSSLMAPPAMLSRSALRVWMSLRASVVSLAVEY